MRILMPSVVDPETHRGGAGTVTRGIDALLRMAPLSAEVEYLPLPEYARLHRVRQAASLARSIGSRLPAKALFTRSRAFARLVERRLREQHFDLLLVNGSDLLWLLDELPEQPPAVLIAHNVEHELYRSQIERTPGSDGMLDPLLRHDWLKLREYEDAGLQKVGRAIFLSRDEGAEYGRRFPRLSWIHVPPVFAYSAWQRPANGRAGTGLDIGMLANFDWWPNQSGLGWLLDHVLPHTGPDLRLHLFGNGSKRYARRHHRLVAHGYVARVERVWSTCDFFVCPIFEGAGVNVKMAEAIYNRVPVLARPFAARGLGFDAVDDPAIVLLDTAAEWIDFLASSSAHALASTRSSEDLTDRFRPETYRQVVESLLCGALEQSSAKESSGASATAGRPGRAPVPT